MHDRAFSYAFTLVRVQDVDVWLDISLFYLYLISFGHEFRLDCAAVRVCAHDQIVLWLRHDASQACYFRTARVVSDCLDWLSVLLWGVINFLASECIVRYRLWVVKLMLNRQISLLQAETDSRVVIQIDSDVRCDAWILENQFLGWCHLRCFFDDFRFNPFGC